VWALASAYREFNPLSKGFKGSALGGGPPPAANQSVTKSSGWEKIKINKRILLFFFVFFQSFIGISPMLSARARERECSAAQGF
jgi:hypothetical protein